MLDLDRLARERGLDYDWKQLKPVCRYCDTRGKSVSISIKWTLSDMAYSHHGSSTPGQTMLGHNGARVKSREETPKKGCYQGA